MKLKELRKENNKTREEISQLLQVALSTYGGYEQETSEPNINTLCKLADLYDVSLDYLVDRQWNNDLGHITKEELDLFKMIKQLSISNFYILQGYVLRLLQEQF